MLHSAYIEIGNFINSGLVELTKMFNQLVKHLFLFFSLLSIYLLWKVDTPLTLVAQTKSRHSPKSDIFDFIYKVGAVQLL